MNSGIDPAEHALGLLDGCNLAKARQLEDRDPAFAAHARVLAAIGARLSTLDRDESDAADAADLRVGAATLAPPQTPVQPRASWMTSLHDRRKFGEPRAPLPWDARDPGPVADATCFLFSESARAITREILHVDGGYHAMAAPLRCG